MSSQAPSKRTVQTNRPRHGLSIGERLARVLNSSVGGKFLVALTGIGLTLFVIAHLIGNLKLFAGREAINSYAQFLKDLGPLLWVARIGLLTIFVLHITWAVRLKWRSRLARPVPYQCKQNIQATLASRYMLTTGLVILAFVLFHLAHYTFGIVKAAPVSDPATGQTTYVNYLDLKDPAGRHDVYAMVVAGFRNPVISVLYVVAQLLLLLHLWHGVGSVFQSLGANAPRWQRTIKALSWAVALFVGLGNIAIVLAVWFGMVRPDGAGLTL